MLAFSTGQSLYSSLTRLQTPETMYGAAGRGKGSKHRAAAFNANSFSRGYQEWENDKETEGAEDTQSQLTSAEELRGQMSCSQKQQEQ